VGVYLPNSTRLNLAVNFQGGAGEIERDMSVHGVTVDDLAIVNLCLEREKRIRSR
jgi:hypothetical protein